MWKVINYLQLQIINYYYSNAVDNNDNMFKFLQLTIGYQLIHYGVIRI